MLCAQTNLNNFFEELFADIKCEEYTRIYISSIYGKYKTAQFDLSKDSITVLLAQARHNRDFLTYQNLGDWIFFSNTMAPSHLRFASKDYYDTVARLSYYSCYKIVDKQMKLYEEMADNFNILENYVKHIFKRSSIIL